MCCSVLQCVAGCCRVLQGGNVVCCRQSTHVQYVGASQCVAVCCSALQCVAVCCSVLQCFAVCCSVLQCVYVVCSHKEFHDMNLVNNVCMLEVSVF